MEILSEFQDFALLFVILHADFELLQVDGLGVFAQNEVDDFLLVVVLHVLLVKPTQSLEAVVHDALQIPLPSPGHIGVGRPSPRVVLGNDITVVSPHVLQVDNELVGVEVVISSQHNGLGVKDTLDIEATLGENGVENVIGYFGLYQVGAIETVEAVGPHDAVLEGDDFLLTDVLDVILEEVVDCTEFLDQVVGSLEFLALAGEVQVIKLVLEEAQVELFDQSLEVDGEVNFAVLLLAQQIDAEHLAVHLLHLVEVLETGLFGLVVGVEELDLRIDSTLLPEHGH